MKSVKKPPVILCICGVLCLSFGAIMRAVWSAVFEDATLFTLFGIPTGIALLLTGLFGLLFSRTCASHGSKVTFCLSLLCSAAAGIGVWAFRSWYIWYKTDYNDAMYAPPAINGPYIRTGWICLLAFVLFVVLYIRRRRTQPSRKGVLMDLGLFALYLVPFSIDLVLLYFTMQWGIYSLVPLAPV